MISARRAPFDRHVERAPALAFGDAGDDHHIRPVRAQVGDIPRDAHIAEHNRCAGGFQTRAQHRHQVHPVGFVTVAVHDEISHVRVQHVVEGQRNLFEMLGVLRRRARHEAPPVAERVPGGRDGCGWSGSGLRHNGASLTHWLTGRIIAAGCTSVVSL
jgi:hypothetical protein